MATRKKHRFDAQAAKNVSRINGNREYLAYMKSREKLFISDDVVERLLQDQVDTFVDRFRKNVNISGRKSSMSASSISKLLREWSSVDGVYGKAISEEIGKSFGNYYTSGGLMVDVRHDKNTSENYASLAAIGYGKAATAAVANSRRKAKRLGRRVCGAVHENLNNIIKTLADINEPLITIAIADCYTQNGGILLPEIAARVQAARNAEIKNDAIPADNIKVVSSMQTIMNNLSGYYAKLDSGASAGELADEIGSMSRSMSTAMNNIVGAVHEFASAHAANVAGDTGEKSIKKHEDEIAKIVASGGGKFMSHWTAQERGPLSGTETKDDIQIVFNKSKATYTIGASVKLRQGEAFRGGRGKTTLGVNGFVARGLSDFESASKQLTGYPGVSGNVFQAGLSMASNMGPDNDYAAASFGDEWRKMRQALGAMILTDAIAGSGIKGASDFSSLLIVNNKVFSVLDILERIASKSDSWKKGSRNTFSVEGLDLWNDVRPPIAAKEKSEKDIFHKAYARNKATYATLPRAKISVTLNLGTIFDRNIMK